MKNSNHYLIIGNGFNLALNALNEKSFEVKLSYKEIITGIQERINNHPQYHKINDFIKKNEHINDVEYMLWILESSKSCLPMDSGIYCKLNSNEDVKELLDNDIKNLRDIFIEVITDNKNHPDRNQIINNNNDKYIEICKENLKPFHRIFTINYDLILYWLLNHTNLFSSEKNPHGFKDGFSRSPYGTQNLSIQKKIF